MIITWYFSIKIILPGLCSTVLDFTAQYRKFLTFSVVF